jgi:endonuclease-3
MPATARAKSHATAVAAGLRRAYPDVTCALGHEDAFQLLVATILSAQCTDERVNQVTPMLFARYGTPEAMAAAPLKSLESLIRSTGFFRNKAKAIQACSRALVRDYGGQVPRDLDALVELPGIGRKTANVVLGTAYGMPTGVVVDTHVTRISRRLGLTKHSDATKIERDLIEQLPRRQWIDFSHRMIHHGRRICKARKPLCNECSLESICPRVGVEQPAASR